MAVGCKKGPCGLLYSTAHVVGSEMSIPLGLLNGFMSKKFPHGEEVYTIHNRMASEGMAERMKGNPGPGQVLSC